MFLGTKMTKNEVRQMLTSGAKNTNCVFIPYPQIQLHILYILVCMIHSTGCYFMAVYEVSQMYMPNMLTLYIPLCVWEDLPGIVYHRINYKLKYSVRDL